MAREYRRRGDYRWCDGQAEQAAEFHVDLLRDSRISEIMHSLSDYPVGKAGDVLMVTFTLSGQRFLGLNDGPDCAFTEAISLSIDCADQAKVDYCRDALSADPEQEQCGWVKAKFGLSWQMAQRLLPTLLADLDRAKARRVMEAMMTMKRIDIAAVKEAVAG